MLNGVGLNSVALNAARSAAFVLATANWSAEATVTSSADIIQSGIGTWDATSASLFTSGLVTFDRSEWVASAIPVFRPNVSWAARSKDWHLSVDFRAIHISYTDAEPVFWKAGASVLTFEPDAILAGGAWVATSNFSGDAELTQPLSASWVAGAGEFDVLEPDRERRTTVDFVTDISFNIEASTNNEDGALDQDAFTNWNAGATWFTDNTLNPIFVAYVDFETVKTDFKGVATLNSVVQCSIEQNLYFDITADLNGTLQGSWSTESDFTVEGKRTRTSEADWEANAVFEPAAGSLYQGQVPFVGTSNLQIDAPIQIHDTGDVQWIGTSQLDPIPVTKIRLAFVGFNAETDFVIEGEVQRFASADWYFVATTFAAAGIQTLVPAPDSRQFILSGKRPRMFMLSPGKNSDRTLELSS